MSFPEKIDAGTLAAFQKKVGSKLRVFCIEETQSTNSDAAKMLASGTPPHDFAICANSQTAGRGRIPGRRWESRAGNILLSLAFRPEKLSPEKLANFTLWLGVAVARMLKTNFGVPAQVKWPNDIFCRGKKMAGMLTEAHMTPERVLGIIFGIGLNVNLRENELPHELRNSTTSLSRELGGNALNVNAVCAELLLALETAYAEFLSGTHRKTLSEIWKEYDCLFGQRVIATFSNEKIRGIADGIDGQGRIKILLDNGTTHAFSAGDISLSARPPKEQKMLD
ncbi:MAG: biotin--[Opitutales bacterium]|nr:biotin--[acetyl-CoA-carboxylase] ligase [Opitutales bacterium]